MNWRIKLQANMKVLAAACGIMVLFCNFTAISPNSQSAMDIISSRLRDRSAEIYKLCRINNNMANHSMRGVRMSMRLFNHERIVLVDHTRRISLCTVAKAGSTFWKSMFIYLSKEKTADGLTVLNELGNKSVLTLKEFSETKDMSKLLTFVETRNPWTRLLSLYQQKIEAFLVNGTPPTNMEQADDYRHLCNVCRRKPDQLVTFLNLLECVIRTNSERRPDIHWTTAYETCDICTMNYDYIIKLENIREEGEFVLSQAGISNPGKIFSIVRNGTIRPSEAKKLRSGVRTTQNYYRDIPAHIIKKIRSMYQYELLLFGYPDSPFT